MVNVDGGPEKVSLANELTRELCVCQLESLSKKWALKLPANLGDLPVVELVRLTDEQHSLIRNGKVRPK